MIPIFNISQKFQYWILKLSPKQFYPLLLEILYKKIMQKPLNLKNPATLSEKIQWIKLNDNKPLKTLLSDKISVKKYIKENLPELKIAKIYKEYNSFTEIDFDKLPETFVIKTNHAYKTHYFILDKNKITENEYKKYEKFYKKVLSVNYAYWGELELQYKNIKPKIYIEEYLREEIGSHFQEYEIYCFNGKPEFLALIIKEGYDRQLYTYDVNWKKLEFKLFFGNDNEIPKPINLDKILSYATLLANDFKFVRVDFFEINNELYFGEMSFTPFAGYIRFEPEKYDLIYGQKLVL